MCIIIMYELSARFYRCCWGILPALLLILSKTIGVLRDECQYFSMRVVTNPSDVNTWPCRPFSLEKPLQPNNLCTEKMFRHVINIKGVNVGDKHYNSIWWRCIDSREWKGTIRVNKQNERRRKTISNDNLYQENQCNGCQQETKFTQNKHCHRWTTMDNVLNK